MKRLFKIVAILTAVVMLLTFVRFEPIVASDEVYITGTMPENLEQRLEGAVVLYVGSPNAFADNVKTMIDKSNLLITPVIKNSRTLVPVRFIAENLGAEVSWNDATSTAVVTLNGKKVSMTVGSMTIEVDNKSIALDTAAQVMDGRTFIPLRALAEALGKKVFYDRGLIVISDYENTFDTIKEKDDIDNLITQINNLPILASYNRLLELLENTDSYRGSTRTVSGIFWSNVKTAETSTMAKQEAVTSTTSQDNSVKADYSETNVQVQGVDEADVVKTDGEYIYQVNKQRIVVAKAYPADVMKIVSVLEFQDKSFNPIELYIYENKLIVIGQAYMEVPYTEDKLQQDSAIAEKRVSISPYYSRSTVKAIVYNIEDKSNIKKLREVEAEGSYISSRRIGASLYFVSNKYADYYMMKQKPEFATPTYRDTAVKEEFINVDYNEIRYFPGMNEPNYMVITSLDLDKNDQPAGIQTYLGSGNNIYVSGQHLYVASYGYRGTPKNTASGIITSILPGDWMPAYEMNTLVYKFSLGSNKVTYLSKGEVPGNILNQFSMDESKGYFRIATTSNNIIVDNINTSANNLYVLDETMNIAGRIENIAPGERIYSVRFMGDRAYMVTFKNVDPLFVIDLKEPTKPTILGALKIPGYSNYLQPYDENHIIGFGKDTVEITRKDNLGNVIGSNAYYLGMKIAIFDVTDVNNPIEEFTEKIGDRGTDSPLLSNHKALLFDKSRNLLAFPISVAEVKGQQTTDSAGFPQYGQTVFQGAYVYNIDTVNGFSLKGKITHLSSEDYLKAGNNIYYGDKAVERLLYIGESLYTLSKGRIKANDIKSLNELGSISIP